jgi:tRNA-splicing ligase RtcB (3'-phosphate/5'-hydroxy nucleic acid ligase)
MIREWTVGVPVETKARQQLEETASLSIVWPWLAVMPDAHWGIGSTVGSVVPTRGAIIPACVGVDLGCGMCAVRTSLTSSALKDNGQAVRDAIERAVPHGRTDSGGVNDRGAWHDVPLSVQDAWAALAETFKPLAAKNPKLETGRQANQLGTLGTGNHFVEVCLDELDRVWIMLHSGSRGIGNRIGSMFIALAKVRCAKEGIKLPNSDLAWLPEGTPEFVDYVEAVDWAQRYARTNRNMMMMHILNALQGMFTGMRADLEAVNCHHNYVARETHFGEDLWITRKGAVSARLGELGLIPGSMGRKSFIVRGKGNVDSFHTCSHGAGRSMSRGAARKTITLEQHAQDTEGVFCRKDADVLDESPSAYKDISAVMEAQKDLVEIMHTLKACVCVKG